MTNANETITGLAAIEYAERRGLTLSKYADPVEGSRHGMTVEEARAVAREDASLIYLDAASETILGVRIRDDFDEAELPHGIVLQAIDTLPADCADVGDEARARGYRVLAMSPTGANVAAWAEACDAVVHYEYVRPSGNRFDRDNLED